MNYIIIILLRSFTLYCLILFYDGVTVKKRPQKSFFYATIVGPVSDHPSYCPSVHPSYHPSICPVHLPILPSIDPSIPNLLRRKVSFACMYDRLMISLKILKTEIKRGRNTKTEGDNGRQIRGYPTREVGYEVVPTPTRPGTPKPLPARL